MADTAPSLGARLNIVDRPPCDCPACGNRERYAVHQRGVRWACGHTRRLPPITATSRRVPSNREASR